MNNRELEQQSAPWCYFHQEEVITGVCPMCLNERLVVLAAKQLGHEDHRYNNRPSRNSITSTAKQTIRFKPSKIFSFSSLLNRFELSHHDDDHHRQFDYYTYSDASISPEDSFISIKFEENGNPYWEKNKVSDVPLEDNCNISWSKETTKSVVEHIKPCGSSLRWRKHIGYLFRPSRWKRPTKGSDVCHVSRSKVVEGVKVRSGWIRSLTKRRRAME